LQLTSGVGAGR